MKAQHVVRLNKPARRPGSVSFVTEGATAIPGVDYVHAEGVIEFKPGESEKVIEIQLLDRPSATTARTFSVVLHDPKALKLAITRATFTIDPGEITRGPLVRTGLVANAYHSVLGRGGYFHQFSGTSEGQAVAIESAFLACQTLRPSHPEQAEWFRRLAMDMTSAMGDGTLTGPMLRQPFPASADVITLMHWLFAARGDIPAQGIVYDFKTTVRNGKLYVPKFAADIFKVWQIYPASSYLLYQSPYSPAYDKANPGAETQVLVTDWRLVGNYVEIPVNVTGEWCVVFGYNNAGTIKQGEAEEAYPVWTRLPDGYSACAPDTFRWLDLACDLAAANDTRPGKPAQWISLRDAMRRTAVRGQAITDLREVIKPMPGLPVLPFSGEPSGMFCYSNHPSATAPDKAPGWSGYNFWSRGADGSILGNVPTSADVRQVQIGRGFNDSWREQTAYQQADQYLWVALSAAAATDMLATGKAYVYVSSTKTYNGATRWYADISLITDWTALANAFAAGGTVDLFIPRTILKRKDLDNAVLPAGTRLENFGVSFEFKGAYQVRIRNMRMVASGDAAGKAGSKMPYFPGAMPFAINADTVAQQFVGWNGSPFHGYQLPDFWFFLGDHAGVVHPNLKAADLATANPYSGALQYQIRATNQNGVAKPKHALLMEQQLLFLQHAQERWAADGGAPGPFAHTFVLNTPARATIGNPTPHTWVYTNDDPNTRWAGYQARVVESIAKIVYLTSDRSDFQDCRDMSAAMAERWLNWLQTGWAADGVVTNGKRIYGPPTDFDDPRTKGISAQYEEPHTPAVLLRACLWLKIGRPSMAPLCDQTIKRCWDYLERLWVPSGSMRFTWSPNPAAGEWFGFWHFEIITTLCVMLTSGALPSSIPAELVRERLLKTQTWLRDIGVK